jgi:hypothetical protein
MSTKEKLIKARVGMLALAEELKNISLACKRAGISRSHFYEIKEAFEKYGPEGLVPATRRRRRLPDEDSIETAAPSRQIEPLKPADNSCPSPLQAQNPALLPRAEPLPGLSHAVRE